MLISVTELKELYTEYAKFDDKLLTRKLAAIETAIRKHTCNKFYGVIRGTGDSDGSTLTVNANVLIVGDTIEIYEGINKGLYVVKEVAEGSVTLDRNLYTCKDNKYATVCYPLDVIEGAISVLNYDLNGRKDNIGIASETISRHSVSYVQRTAENTVSGYPAELFTFCDDYMCART